MVPVLASAILATVLLAPVATFGQTAERLQGDPVDTAPALGGEFVGYPTDEEATALRKEVEEIQKLQKTQNVSGITTPSCGITEFGCALLVILNWLADFIIYLVYPLGESFLNGIITYNFEAFAGTGGHFGVATNIGWGIVLGVVNLFFVLWLLWIAIATIFDFQPFTAKQTLAKLIIAALLINFSLPIGRSVINLSNGIALIFQNQINRNMGGVANAVSAIFDPQVITLAVQNKYARLNQEEARKVLTETRKPITGFVGPFSYLNREYTALECYGIMKRKGDFITSLPSTVFDYAFETLTGYATIGAHLERNCSSMLSDTRIARAVAAFDPEYGKLTLLAAAFITKIFVAPIALFAIFAAAIFLLTRLILLMLLLVGAPLAFFSLAIPLGGAAGQWGWNAWWNNLFKWSFFFPTFLFLFMLSLLVLQQIPVESKKLILAGEPVPDVGILFLNYLVGIGLMIASITVANQMGIYGANTVTGWGKKAAGATGKWARGTGKIIGGGTVGAALSSAAGRWVAAGRYRRHLLRPLEAATAAGQKVREQREKAALQRRGLAAKASPEYRLAVVQGMAPSERADFIREMKPHQVEQLTGVMTPQQQATLYQEMKQYKLEEKVLDAVKDLNVVIAAETGVATTDPRFQEAMNSWLKSTPPAELQKRISANDIRTNASLHRAIQQVAELSDLKTIANAGDKAEALRQHFIDLGNRTTFDSELAVGFSEVEASERAIGRAITALQATNRELANDLVGSPAVQVNLARSRPLGRKTGPPVVVVQQPAPPPPTP